jgi:hypothetical protein
MRASPSIRQLVKEVCMYHHDSHLYADACAELTARLSELKSVAADELVQRQLLPSLLETLLQLHNVPDATHARFQLSESVALVISHVTQLDPLFRIAIDDALIHTLFSLSHHTTGQDARTLRIIYALARFANVLLPHKHQEEHHHFRRCEIVSTLASLSVIMSHNERVVHTADVYLRAICNQALLPDLDDVQASKVSVSRIHSLYGTTCIVVCAVNCMPETLDRTHAVGDLLVQLLYTNALDRMSCTNWFLDGISSALAWTGKDASSIRVVLKALQLVRDLASVSQEHQQVLSAHDVLARAIATVCDSRDASVRRIARDVWRTLLRPAAGTTAQPKVMVDIKATINTVKEESNMSEALHPQPTAAAAASDHTLLSCH